MLVDKTPIEGAEEASGTVVVIDVIRAFTTAAYALAAGARDIVLVDTVEEALRLRDCFPGSLLMGEVGGVPIPGFDFGNSPAELVPADLEGRRMIQRTSNGTQGMVRSQRAETLLAGSFVCAKATERWIRRAAAPQLTFVITGIYPGSDGDEDAALADYLEARLDGHELDAKPFLERVYASIHGERMAASDDSQLREDIVLCAELDRFEFAMPVSSQDGLLVLSAAAPD